ncbi:Glycosylphosphatidylinositol:protein transamidase, GAA1 component [Patellaria atrata CBS 101060]|uniref:Glycosylphosphatidylinositol:protein transamidase, GAA1 component n=1 Tax=Patellaria atrata CBS 101060 TaxID=1346257 RepID=A0A9P4SB22_9PEZI|nr:Glycosylphosphatidylinositol:protein transamidase, GAA1 component [Patellaria atrata CBS 101060]
MSLQSSILGLRRDPRLLKVPPYLSALCIIVGVVWLFLLPLNEYSRSTYVSENALLPGQVHTYFGGSEHNIFRAYRHEVAGLADKSIEERNQKLLEIFKSAGLKVATQKYEYQSAGKTTGGENVYAILQGPRADATEAIALVAAWTTMNGEINHSGVALVLTLARYFKRWSLWSKDLIFIISSDSTAGTQAWVDAYHNAHDPSHVESLPLKSGALQGALAIEYPAGPWGHRFDKIHIVYDGINGQLPNLDLINTAVSVSSQQIGISTCLQRMWKHGDSYEERLQTMLRGMINQGLGHASGPHSSFIPYHIDAITLQTVGDGWHDEMSLGRVVESLFRSLNNLLEHLHQSFFFYLLMQSNRFVSIGTYLPSAMLIAVNFTITSIGLWIKSGRPEKPATKIASTDSKPDSKPDMTIIKQNGMTALVPTATFSVVERRMFLPLAFVGAAHFLGILPLYLFNHAPANTLLPTFQTFAASSLALPLLTAFALSRFRPPTTQETVLIQCFSLLFLGLFLSALATLNFSLSLLIGLLAAPLTFIRRPSPSTTQSQPSSSAMRVLLSVAGLLLLAVLSPSGVVFAATKYWNTPLVDVLLRASFGWQVHGLWTQVVVWLVWWPAWFCGTVVMALGLF